MIFVTERVCQTILPTIKPVKRTFTAAVQAKKTMSAGIGARKLKKEDDDANSPITSKMEKTKYNFGVNPMSIFD